MWQREEPGKVRAGVLAVAVHLLFFGLLIFGVTWQSRQPDAVQVDLWKDLPVAKPAQSQPRPQPRAEPKPEPKPKLEPKPQPKPEPKAEPKPAPKPDIALKEKEEKRKREEKQRLEEEKRKLEEQKRKQAEDKERQRLMQERLAKETEELKRQQEQQAVLAQMQAQAQAQQAAVQAQLVNDFKSRIRAKIKQYIVLPPDIQGNPQAEFDVVLLPGGDVLSAKLTRTSGNAAYDSAVERAIYKAQPLPLPPDPSLFSSFRELHLKFRPTE
jgi:colicin import membrane protein